MNGTEIEGKKRRRVYGKFRCDVCDKQFIRADHLVRHKRNHDPQYLKYVCNWPGCGQKFFRNDVKEKHYKRHQLRLEKGVNDDSSNEKNEHQNLSYANTDTSTTHEMSKTQAKGNLETKSDTHLNQELEELGPPVVQNHQNHLHRIQPAIQDLVQDQTNGIEDAIPDMASKTLSPSDLIEWLFHDETIPDALSGANHNASAFPNRHATDITSTFSPMTLLENIFAVSPNFPHSHTRKTIDENVRHRLIEIIPSLDLNPDFNLIQIERFLEIYWLIYHPQYPILHRPSFTNFECHPLLLLAMIMLGASLTSCTGYQEAVLFHNPEKLANEIAEPLRWLIFSNPDCKPPAKVWVVQSLLLLETFEITSSSRALHERAYLHHGAKIQILRRSPILGGDPLKDDNEEGAYILKDELWKKWIEIESMKRATLMAFYLDTVHATVYGHIIILYAHQIKLSLPCEDELWEFENSKLTTETLPPVKTPKFLGALKSLLHKRKVHTSAFGKKILLAGLLTIMFQMQQKDLQLSFLEWDSIKDSWNETISLAIDVWRIDICSKGNCCDTETSLYFPKEDQKLLPPMLRVDDTRCKFSLYHIAQIYMRITHYDYIIYAGAPSRMNVVAGTSEYRVVSHRVKEWSTSINGRISVIHAYMLLCEMLLSPDNEDIIYTYAPNTDPFLHRKNIIASAALVVFAYNFSLEGPESLIFQERSITDDYYPEKEDGYSYLKRIRRCLSQTIGGQFHTAKHSNSTVYHNSIKLHAESLQRIENKNHIVGLMKIFYKGYKNCNWEIGCEYSRLLKNCIERSLGRRKITCDGMYSNT